MGWKVQGSNSGTGNIFHTAVLCLDQLCDPPGLSFSGYHGSLLGGRVAGSCLDQSSPSDTEVTNEWSFTSTPSVHSLL